MKITVTRRLAWELWLTALALYFAVWLYPISSTLTRSLGIATLAAVWLGLGALAWRRRAARGAWVCVTLFCAVFMALPGRGGRDTAAMRGDFTAGLRRYTGTRYAWGGESPRGIDCSGLMRRGMIDGMFLRGVRTFDPGLARWSIWLWWHDCSARDLGNGNGMTTHLFDTVSINAMDQSRLEPGDMAVTATGIHVMAYLGDKLWIEADPGAGKVITVSAPTKDNPWFREHMKIVRWDVLR